MVSVTVAWAIGAVAFSLPIAASVYFSSRQSLEAEMDAALAIADEVLRRSDEITRQASDAVDRLSALPAPPDPCADERIALMRELSMKSSYLQAVGHIENGALACSSNGRHVPAIPLGPVDYISSKQANVRTRVRLPVAPDVRFIVTDRGGYGAIIHRDTPLDVFIDDRSVLVGVMSSSGRVILSRGDIDPRWLRALPAGGSARYSGHDYVLGLRRSAHYDLTAIAAVPAAYLASRTRELLVKVLPVGLLAGIALAWVVQVLLRQQASLAGVLRTSLRKKEFFVLYQPVFDLRSGRCVGAEALARWRRPGGGVVMPDVFIPVAESSNQIEALTAAVFECVERDLGILLKESPRLAIGVNVAPADLHTNLIEQRLARLFEHTDVEPHNVMLEVTERALVDFERSGEIIRNLRTMGVRVAIDDFGTGYSSLSYLTSLHVDCLKIDKSFVDTIGSESATSKVVFHIIEMAKSLELRIVAEGVETEEQARFLREHGVDCAQGWLFGKPMPPAELQRLLAEQAARQEN